MLAGSTEEMYSLSSLFLSKMCIYLLDYFSWIRTSMWLSDAIVEKSGCIQSKAVQKQFVIGRSRTGVLGAAEYIAYPEMGTTSVLNEIS